jgi:hypothetical protein
MIKGPRQAGYADSEMKDRVAGVAGIVFVVLFVVAVVQHGPGNPNVPANQIAGDLAANRTSVILTSYLILAALVPFVLFAVSLVTRLSAVALRSSVLSVTSVVGAAISTALIAASSAILGALAGYIADGSSPETVRALYGVYDGLFTAGGLFLGFFVFTTSWIGFSARSLPAPLRWAGIVVGGLLMIGAGTLAFPFKGVGPAWVLGEIGSILWILGTSIWTLMRRSEPPGSFDSNV